ncbi:SLC13 family permease [Sedimentibacter sp.]|uniref:SLC13 family permease n=1 Tax=Sedimentibacter sp. TaxID=1960295 RepID=UPI00289FAD8F|nr:SLC13 family permease [Sedimentibacter sp.]
MYSNKRLFGLILGIVSAAIIYILPLEGLSYKGKMCMALTLMTVVFWAFEIVQSGFSSGIYLVLLIIFKVAEPEIVFSPWIGSTMYLVIGAYLIASSVKSTGLGERIAYMFILKFVYSYKSIIISTFILTGILSIIIPHPWARSFLIMSVMSVVIKSADIPKEDSIKIGFSVFAASVPVSMIFLTGDSVINSLAVQASGSSISWIQWFVYMGPPNIVASILTCILILVLFKPTKEVNINKEEIKEKLNALGSISSLEKKTITWLTIAVVLWLTDSIHGINIGWITLFISMLMSFPVIGEILSPKHWGEVPVHVLLFLTAAMTIGKVGAVTGMNNWIVENILPSSITSNLYVLIIVISVGIHMVVGSVIAVMGIAIPALLIFTEQLEISSVAITLMVYTSIGIHYILPFHHLNILVGQGEENGMYGQKEVMRLGIPLTVVVFIIVLLEVPYWKIIGLL